MKMSTYHAYKRLAEQCFSKALNGRIRVATPILKIILLEYGDSAFCQGQRVYMKKRSLGAGVWEIWFEPENKA